MTIESTPSGLDAGTWTLDGSHSEVGFSVRHAGISKVRGKFGEVEATATVGETLGDSSVTATIKTESFFSGDPNRDAHVRSGDFLDAEQFPELTFVSTSLTGQGLEVFRSQYRHRHAPVGEMEIRQPSVEDALRVEDLTMTEQMDGGRRHAPSLSKSGCRG